VLRGGGCARDVHSEDAVSASRILVPRLTRLTPLLAAGALALVELGAFGAFGAFASCTPKLPSPSATLEGRRGDGGRRVRDGSPDDDDEEDERDDVLASEAGISSRALSCVNDRDCMTHRCDVPHKRCRFPCRSDEDCNPGAHCATEGGSLAACFTR
jgi:hypothetical protein